MIDPFEKRKEIKKKLRKLEGLPTLPPIVQKLNQMIEDERTSLNQVAEIIEKDQVITTKILRLANSAFYGFPRKVSTVNQAIMLLGFNVVKILIMTSSIFEIIHKEDIGLWEHSIGVAACAKIIAERIEIPEPQEIATAGLLHDLGKVIELVSFKEEYQAIKNLVSQGINSLEAERRILGMDHSEIGAFLLSQWNLPEKIVEAIFAHHDSEKTKKYKKEASILHLANIIIQARGYGQNLLSGNKIYYFDSKTLKWLNLSTVDLREIVFTLEPILYELKFFTLELEKSLNGN